MRSESARSQFRITLAECKNLARVIKRRRTPILVSNALATQFVSRAIADNLIDIYLSTIDRVYRIIHVPTFRTDYERYWADPQSVHPSFKMQMQLCAAIGASMVDDKFDMREAALRWTFEARLWLILPPHKASISVAGVQVMLLLQIARQAVGVGGGVTWPDAGSLLRSAMYAGLHRDPRHLPRMTVLRAEIRRRLWAAILEMQIQTSIDSGGPPLISLDDYDTEPPSNLDDDQLTDDLESSEHRPIPSSNTHTQTSLQLLLLQHFPIRLAVAKFVNDLGSKSTYEETLRLNGELTSSCHAISRRLNKLISSSSSSSHSCTTPPITLFHKHYVELMTYRFIIALHNPLLTVAFDNPAYYFSRKMLVDTVKRISPLAGAPNSSSALPGEVDFFNHIVCSSGFTRSTLKQAIMLLGHELVTVQKEEIRDFGEAGTPDAASKRVLEDAVVWMGRRIRAGETNVKGLLFTTALLNHIEGVQKGVRVEELEGWILSRMKEGVERAYELMKESAESYGIEVDGGTGGGEAREVGRKGVGGEEREREEDEVVMDLEDGDPFDVLGWNFDIDWDQDEYMTNFVG